MPKITHAELKAYTRRIAELEAAVNDLRGELLEYKRSELMERQAERLRDRIQKAQVHIQPLIGKKSPAGELADAVDRALEGKE